ncbi:MAG TPA: hypothetical protein VNQ76_05965 [Planctomicrobium sp.]|nr:hypothetical protein [Planctomicrobium sp.]
MKTLLNIISIYLLMIGSLWTCSNAQAGQLYIGASTISITPNKPVALDGQRAVRIATKVESPCMATALAIETRNEESSIEQAIFVSCDLLEIRGGDNFYESVRRELTGRIPHDVLGKIILNATHSHTAPVTVDGKYDLPASGVMQPSDYQAFLVKQLGTVIVNAWKNREPAQVAWGLGHAVVAQNRRAVYADGTAVMYGKTNQASFRGIEGYEDHGVEILYFWNAKDELIATAINIACPAQEASGVAVNADFWHPVREALQKQYGKQLMVLGWGGAGGDQSPRPMYRNAAEERMRKLRGHDRLSELARRIVNAWEDVYEVVKPERRNDILFEHRVKTVMLPYRQITGNEYDQAKEEIVKLEGSNAASAYTLRNWHRRLVNRFEQQQSELPYYDQELHAVRLGDVAIVTNDFELFTDYGVQMKSRSPALQTFVLQLCGSGTYLPTQTAVTGGGYSAVAQSCIVGPEGGQVLVNETLNLLEELWKRASH